MDDYWLTHMTYPEVPEDVPTLGGHGSRAMRTRRSAPSMSPTPYSALVLDGVGLNWMG
ncbi:hypothetical protein KEF85_00310 [Methylomonas paludis]|uniref:Uncharacterized protein n=1 Tax=Methylomonas paludis TaxID=1173101 RepID=A0A975MN92_9GAMM|nr:hypothetical protein [Methylomonas paludis]QWF70981.1 hypothetical protein KEF85_00310 [Methylomonas paludis]